MESGQFLEPFACQSGNTDLNEIVVNAEHGLVITGSKLGFVECFDPRVRKSVACFYAGGDVVAQWKDDILAETPSSNELPTIQVTALEANGALELGVGFSTGHILLYDLRSSTPTVKKDLRYALPVKGMKFVHGGPEHESIVLSTDTRCVKLWRKQTGEPITAMEMENDVHSMEVVPNTGLCMFLWTALYFTSFSFVFYKIYT